MKKVFVASAFALIFFSCTIIEDDDLDSDQLKDNDEYVNNLVTLQGYSFHLGLHNLDTNSATYNQFSDETNTEISGVFQSEGGVAPLPFSTDFALQLQKLYGSHLMPATTEFGVFNRQRNTNTFVNITEMSGENSLEEPYTWLGSDFTFDGEKLTSIENRLLIDHVPTTIQKYEFIWSGDKITQVVTEQHLYRQSNREMFVDQITYEGDVPVRIEREILIDGTPAGTAEIIAQTSGNSFSSISWTQGGKTTEYDVNLCSNGCTEILTGDAGLRLIAKETDGVISNFELQDYRVDQSGTFLRNDIHRLPDGYFYHPFYSLYFFFRQYQADQLMLLYLPDWWIINNATEARFSYSQNEFIRFNYDYRLR